MRIMQISPPERAKKLPRWRSPRRTFLARPLKRDYAIVASTRRRDVQGTMLRRKIIVLTLVCALLTPAWAASLPQVKPEDVGLSGERLNRIQTMIQGYIDRKEIAG